MASEWTLPLIRIELDGLPFGCDFILAPDDTERLFGMNSAAARRIATFAAGHGCRAIFRRKELVFQKRVQPSAPTEPLDPSSVECFPPLCDAPRPTSDDYPPADCR
jgi:hypothetical protein